MEFIKEIKSTLFMMSGLYIITGLFMLIAPSFVNNLICYLVGTICLIIGGLFIYTYISSEVYGSLSYAILIIAVCLIVLGVFIITDPVTFASFLPFVMGVVLVIDAFTKMQSSLTLKKYKYTNWWIILIGAMVIFAFGILLILNPFDSLLLFIRLLGIFLIVDAIECILTASSYNKIKHEIK